MASKSTINANLCLQHLTQLLTEIDSPDSTDPAILSAVSSIDELKLAVSHLRSALNLQADTPANDYFTLEGLSDSKLNLSELVTAGASSLNVRTRGEAEAEMLNMKLFDQFVAAVKEKGFFNGAKPGEHEYEERFKKIIVKFRSKLAAAAKAKESKEARVKDEASKNSNIDAASKGSITSTNNSNNSNSNSNSNSNISSANFPPPTPTYSAKKTSVVANASARIEKASVR